MSYFTRFLRVFSLLYLIILVHSFALPQSDAGTLPDAPTPEPALPEPADANDDGDQGGELIGDLLNGITTPIGKSIANVLTGAESGLTSFTATPPAKATIPGCKKSADTCCIWYAVAADLTAAFKGPSGRCNELARGAIRLGFHDAGTWSKALKAKGQDFGGADGSFVLFNEITRTENRGLELITLFTNGLYAKYKGSGVGMGDLIQFQATHAVVTCPLGPRVRFFAGRKVRHSFQSFKSPKLM
jgi:hypothetical protein